MSESRVGEHNYRIGKLSPRQQLHVFRRISPVIASAGGIASIQNLSAAAGASTEGGISADQVFAFAGMLAPMLEILAKMPDAEIDYVIDACLGVCSREQDGGRGWAPVMHSGAMAFEDIDLLQMLELTGKVLIGDGSGGGLADFLSGRPSTLGGAAPLSPPA